MTLIIGLKCQDGVVLGADGSALFGDPSFRTVHVHVKNKIRVHADAIAIGFAGAIGLGQRLVAKIGDQWPAEKIRSCLTGVARLDGITTLLESIYDP